jgi:hypothetical protein
MRRARLHLAVSRKAVNKAGPSSKIVPCRAELGHHDNANRQESVGPRSDRIGRAIPCISTTGCWGVVCGCRQELAKGPRPYSTALGHHGLWSLMEIFGPEALGNTRTRKRQIDLSWRPAATSRADAHEPCDVAYQNWLTIVKRS